MKYIRVRFESNRADALNYLESMVFIGKRSKDGRKYYWTECGLFFENEADKASNYMRQRARPGVKGSLTHFTIDDENTKDDQNKDKFTWMPGYSIRHFASFLKKLIPSSRSRP